MTLPPDWKAGKVVSQESTFGDPPESADPGRVIFFGLRDGDEGHRLYSIPAATPVAEIVRIFRVGSHGAQSYGWNENKTVEMVAAKVGKIAERIPSHVTFADPAGLTLKFLRRITEQDLAGIEEVFPEDEAMEAGLEKYISEWDGTGRLLGDVAKENMIQLWWD